MNVATISTLNKFDILQPPQLAFRSLTRPFGQTLPLVRSAILNAPFLLTVQVSWGNRSRLLGASIPTFPGPSAYLPATAGLAGGANCLSQLPGKLLGTGKTIRSPATPALRLFVPYRGKMGGGGVQDNHGFFLES